MTLPPLRCVPTADPYPGRLFSWFSSIFFGSLLYPAINHKPTNLQPCPQTHTNAPYTTTISALAINQCARQYTLVVVIVSHAANTDLPRSCSQIHAVHIHHSCCFFYPSDTGNPFSIKLLSLGAGGTLPTHERIFTPATVTVHVPQSPFLQSVGTLIPNFWHAYIRTKSAQSFRQQTMRHPASTLNVCRLGHKYFPTPSI